MAAYASLVSLMNIIHDVEHHPSPPVSLDRQLVEPITRHITFFQEFLESYNPPLGIGEDDEEAADPLEMRIADAAYAAEDAIETHIVDIIQQQSNFDDGSKITHLMNCFRAPKRPKNPIDEKLKSIKLCRDSLQHVIEEMKSIEKVVVVNVDAEKKKKKMALVVPDQVTLKSAPSSVARNGTMVGSDGVMLEIMEKLTGGRSNLQVIPIVGMGGIGKTFLAKTIYADPRVKDRFDICAWATISQQYKTREILRELLSQATKRNKEDMSGKSVDELGSELRKYLFYRRFLIVMDDMWSIDSWDKIQHYFPDKSNGSRVLVTTRLSQLCSQLNNDYSLPMSFLDEASSWDLFSRTVFVENSCPPELKKIAEKIVANCRGLPLSIVVVGGLLKNMDDTQGSWESIRDNLTSVVNMENDKHCLRLLKLSYNHLPVYLKPCFLYMGVFEEDDKIRTSMLVNLWVSEGFLKPRNGESLETTARGLLQDLVDRNLILIDMLGSTGSIKSCKIHDLLRDLCLKEAQKYGFYHVIGKCNHPSQGMNTQRRIVIPRNTSKKIVRGHLRSMPNARSIICEHGKVPPGRNLGLLRTLHAYKFRFYSNKKYLNSLAFRYVNLRHLAIEARGISSFLRSVSLIWNLHTFIVTIPYKATLLADIWKMPQFRHIEFVNECLSLPDPPSVVREDDVVIMENLHTLKGVLNFKCCEGVVKRIPNIKKLKLEYQGLLGTDNKDEHCVGNMKSLCGLESLKVFLIKVRESNIYMQKLSFPHSLKKLTLEMDREFEWDDGMLEKIGSLPHLEKLILLFGRFGKGTWETFEGQFPCLKYLGLYLCSGLEHWTAAEEGSSILPSLRYLDLNTFENLEKIPSELGNIDTLKSIKLSFCGEGAVKSAKEIVDEQVESQGEQLSFHVRVHLLGKKYEHLQSLSGPNFEVHLCRPVADDEEEEAAVDPLEMRIAGAAHAAEDAIEYHIVDCIKHKKKYKKAKDEKIKSILQSVIQEMDSIKKMTLKTKKPPMMQVIHDQVAMKNDVTASHDVLLEIMEKLAGGQLDFQIIPIVGMGGIGKTFLAQTIYSKPLIKEHFDIYAWATISQNYDTREILCEILSQATNTNKEELSGESVDELGLELHKCLFSRRFMIVMDDMWSIDSWDKIQRYFPSNDNGSRVLVTTRLLQLCLQLNNNNYSMRMSFLDKTSSWDLFSKTVFGEKSSCPPEITSST